MLKAKAQSLGIPHTLVLLRLCPWKSWIKLVARCQGTQLLLWLLKDWMDCIWPWPYNPTVPSTRMSRKLNIWTGWANWISYINLNVSVQELLCLIFCARRIRMYVFHAFVCLLLLCKEMWELSVTKWQRVSLWILHSNPSNCSVISVVNSYCWYFYITVASCLVCPISQTVQDYIDLDGLYMLIKLSH